MKTDHSQNRHFARVPFHAGVQLHFPPDNAVQSARLLDISLKGALVETALPIVETLMGRICRMVLVLGLDDECIAMEGTVIHQEGAHIGIRCESIDVDSITRLRQLLELNMGDSDLLDRELIEMIRMTKAT